MKALLSVVLACAVASGALQHPIANCDSLLSVSGRTGIRCSKEANGSQLLRYLNGVTPDKQNAKCVTFAIDEVGRLRYAPAIPVLVRLIDFKRPPTEAEERGTHIRMRGFYPAVNALEEIGEQSRPSVLDAIKDPSTSVKAQENAVSVWMELFKYETPHGISILRQEADKSNAPNIKERLMWAILRAQNMCNPEDQLQCKEAAKMGGIKQ